MNLREYAKKYDRGPDNNFAVSCYNDNSIDELRDAKTQLYADYTDMRNWEITDDQEWYDAIDAAINEKSGVR